MNEEYKKIEEQRACGTYDCGFGWRRRANGG